MLNLILTSILIFPIVLLPILNMAFVTSHSTSSVEYGREESFKNNSMFAVKSSDVLLQGRQRKQMQWLEALL